MSFEVPVKRIRIEPHPNADRVDLARVGGFISCVGRGQFRSGELVAYIREGAVLPKTLLDELGLAGDQHLRGVVVRPLIERRHPELGRLQLKCVSPAYLLRKGGTEFN